MNSWTKGQKNVWMSSGAFFCAEATEQKAARTIRDVFLQFVPNIWKNPRIICIFLICLEFEPGDGLHRQPVCQQTHDNIV